MKNIIRIVQDLFPTRRQFASLGGCFMQIRTLPFCLRSWWRKLPKNRRRFLPNLIVGLSMAVLVHYFHDSPFLREKEDAAMDWVMRIRKGAVKKEPAIPFGWIDIDEKTYRDWDEPLYLPRTKIADLIEFAIQSDPRMVVVDIDLAQRGHDKDFDQPVVEILEKHAADCQGKPLNCAGCPPIVLIASLRTSDSTMPEQRPSHLDDIVSDSPHFFWASPLFEKDWDQNIRRWRIWESVRSQAENMTIKALPSCQLLAGIFLTEPEGTVETVQNCLDSAVTAGFRTTAKASGDNKKISIDCMKKPVDLWTPDHDQREIVEVDLFGDRLAQRIVYNIPWQEAATSISDGTIPITKTIEEPARKDKKSYHPERLLLSRVSALNLSGTKGRSSIGDFKDRVVFIGGSFRDSRDIHATPLGEMPGVLILINAFHSLLQYGKIKEVLAVILLVEAILIVFAGVVFSLWDSFLAWSILSLVIGLALIPLSIILFGYGFWMDFALPFFAVQLQNLISSYEDGRQFRHPGHGKQREGYRRR